MLTAEIIQKIGQKNVSKNAGLTKERVIELFKSATRKDKNAIDELTGLKRVSLNRVYKTGSVSAKIAVAIAQVLNVDPHYITGEANARGKCTDKAVRELLTANGFGGLLEQDEKPARVSGRSKKAAGAPAEPVKEPYSAPGETPEFVSAAGLAEEEAQQLLRSLHIQAKHDPAAENALNKVKNLLIYGSIPDEPVKPADGQFSTSIILYVDAKGRNGGTLHIEAKLYWGASLVSLVGGYTGDKLKLGCEYVWYDLYVYDGGTGVEIAKKKGIYGDTALHLRESGSGYIIEK